jgi:hypothetical protein
MKIARVLGVVFLVVALPACGAVLVEQPAGDTPLALDPEAWEGAWVLDGDLYMARVVDSERGELEIAAIDKDADGEFVFEKMTLLLRDGGDWIIGNLRDEEWEESGFAVAVGKLQEDQLLILLPDIDKFRALVEAGTLPGRVEGDSLLLEPLDAEHLALILPGEHGNLFDLDDGIGVARRVAK